MAEATTVVEKTEKMKANEKKVALMLAWLGTNTKIRQVGKVYLLTKTVPIPTLGDIQIVNDRALISWWTRAKKIESATVCSQSEALTQAWPTAEEAAEEEDSE